jgi:LuxR family maltose regulon positive regulatory protein
MAAGDATRAAELMERATFDMNRTRQEWVLRRLHASLPDGMHGRRPVLAIGYVGALMATGTTEGVAALLDAAERASRQPYPGSDTEAGARLPALIEMHRAGLLQLQGDTEGVIKHARRAIEVAAEDDHLSHGGASSLIALALWTTGDVQGAERAYAEGMARVEKAGYEADVVGGAVSTGDLLIAQGRLTDAARAYERGLERATRGGGPPLRGAADMHVGLAAIAYERNDLGLAVDNLRRSDELGEANGMPKNPCRWRLGQAAIHAAQGDLTSAFRLLDEAERRYNGDFSPEVRPVAAIRARVWIAHGRLDEARTWALERRLAPEDEPTYLREYEHATLARLLVAEGRRDQARLGDAVALIDRLLPPAQAAGRTGSVIDLLAVLATARQARGDRDGAIGSLTAAAALAEPEGHVRVFLDEGAPMVELLRMAAARADATPGIRRLAGQTGGGGVQPSAPREALVEPLSEREREVLALLDSDLNGPEIANRLFLSVNTLRSHTRHIYGKLGVGTRRAAVSRAAELGLLSRDRERSA